MNVFVKMDDFKSMNVGFAMDEGTCIVTSAKSPNPRFGLSLPVFWEGRPISILDKCHFSFAG